MKIGWELSDLFYFDWEIRFVKTGKKLWLNGKCAWEYAAERKVSGKWVRL